MLSRLVTHPLSSSHLSNHPFPLPSITQTNASSLLCHFFPQSLTHSLTPSPPPSLPPTPLQDMWYATPLSEIDFSQCRKCTPSYRALPKSYPKPVCSERSEVEASLLNDVVRMYLCVCTYVCVCVCLDGWMDGWKRVHKFVCVYVCEHVCMYERSFLCIFVCFCVFVRTYVYMLDKTKRRALARTFVY